MTRSWKALLQADRITVMPQKSDRGKEKVGFPDAMWVKAKGEWVYGVMESRKAYRLMQAYVRKIDFFFIIIYLRILFLRGSTPILRDRGFFQITVSP